MESLSAALICVTKLDGHPVNESLKQVVRQRLWFGVGDLRGVDCHTITLQ
jgi:hypothetical protein